MKLIVSSEDVGNPTIPVRWCIAPEEVQHLKQYKTLNHYLLLVIINSGTEVDRQVVPLSQMLTYINFSRPGKNRVAACIVSDSVGLKEVRKNFLRKDGYGDYWHTVLDDGKLAVGYAQTGTTIQVAKEFFAKEPPTWERFWVNLWFETKPRDQCQFRRRRMLAYTVQPLPVLLYVLGKTIVRFFIASFWGIILAQREVGWKAVVHPFRYNNEDVWFYAKSAAGFFGEDAKGNKRSALVLMFWPPFYLMGFLILYAVLNEFLTLNVPWYYLLLAGPLVFPCGLGIFALAMIVGPLLQPFLKRLSWTRKAKQPKPIDEVKLKKQREKEAEEQRKIELALTAQMRRLEESYAAVTCNGPVVPRLDALPKDRQTIHLRFLDLKAKVCKPFAR